MTRTTSGWMTVAMLLAGAAGAQQDPGEGSHAVTFEPPGGGGPPIELRFEGKVYGPEGWLDRLEAGQLDDAEAFVLRVIATNRDGDLDAMAALWLPAERDELRATAGGELFERNRGFFESITASAFRSRVDFGDYRIFFVQHESPLTEDGTTVNVYPIRRVDGRYYLTNALQDEFAFRYLALVYRTRLIAQPSER